jgi:hypothetical protein
MLPMRVCDAVRSRLMLALPIAAPPVFLAIPRRGAASARRRRSGDPVAQLTVCTCACTPAQPSDQVSPSEALGSRPVFRVSAETPRNPREALPWPRRSIYKSALSRAKPGALNEPPPTSAHRRAVAQTPFFGPLSRTRFHGEVKSRVPVTDVSPMSRGSRNFRGESASMRLDGI